MGSGLEWAIYSRKNKTSINKYMNNYLLSKNERNANQNMRLFFIHQVRQMWFVMIIFHERSSV